MLNEALRLIRVYHELSQTKLCKQLEISNAHLSEIESGKKQPSMELLLRYSKYFEIPLSSLIFFAENIGNPRMLDKFRSVAAGKIISLLQWAEKKNEDTDSEKDR